MKNSESLNFNLIIPKGTQIVLLNKVKILNKNVFQKEGTVGVISSLPNDGFHAYKIEFLDGTFGMANRKDFSIRKQFQSEQSGILSPLENFQIEDFIIYRCVVGSKAFGLDDENSDTDWRGIYLPPADLHWSMFGVPEQIENKEAEECFWELQKFLILALKANPNILECLHTPLIEYADDTAQELLSIKQIFFSKLIYQTYNGYVMSQFKKLEQDLRSTGAIRWKHVMHLIRLLLQGMEILQAGELNVKVGENREKLLLIKRGEMVWQEINEWRLRLYKDFESAYEKTTLPERPNYEKANEFLIKARKSMVK